MYHLLPLFYIFLLFFARNDEARNAFWGRPTETQHVFDHVHATNSQFMSDMAKLLVIGDDFPAQSV